MIMDSQRKKEIKKNIKSIINYLYGDLRDYKYGYRVYGGCSRDNYSVAARYLRRYMGYKIEMDGFNTYYILGPEYKSPPKIVSMLTRLGVTLFGAAFAIIWIMLFILSIPLTILQYPFYWIYTGDTVEDDDALIYRLYCWTGEFIDWIWFKLKYHRLLEMK